MQQFFADDPIKSKAADELNRKTFAARCILLLNRVREQSDSAVLGLIGPWGSGKSSIVELIELELEASDEWIVGHYAPWSYANYEAAVPGFFDELRECLPEDQKWSTVRQTLGRIGSRLAPLGALAGLVGISGDTIIEKTAEALAGDLSPSALHKQAEESLQSLDKPILIILDDLDRLEPAELLNTFRLIRLVGRLPNVYYLVAYDEATLLDVLRKTDLVGDTSGRAQDYLEKMVQIRLDVPPLLDRQTMRLFNEGLDAVVSSFELTLTEIDTTRLSSAFFGNMERWLSTPRAIKRFLGQVDAFYGMTEGEVDFTDFLLMTFIRTFEPQLYWKLHSLQSELTHQPGKSQPLTEVKQLWRQRVSDLVGAEKVDASMEILSELFIPIQSAERNMLYGHDWYQQVADRKGVGSSDYFNRYYHYGVAEGDVSDREVARLVGGLTGEDVAAAGAQLKALLDSEPELVRSKLDNLEKQGQLDPAAGLSFLAATYDSLPELVGAFKISLDYWALSIGRRLLAKSADVNPTATGELLSRLADAGDSQLEYVAALLDAGASDLADAGAWHTELVGHVVARIKDRLTTALSQSAADVPDDLFDLIWRWKHLGGEVEVTEFLWSQAIKPGRWDLTDVLVHIVTTATGYGDGLPRKTVGSFDLTSVNNLLGLERVADALSSELDAVEGSGFISSHAPATAENKRQYAIQTLHDWRKAQNQPETLD